MMIKENHPEVFDINAMVSKVERDILIERRYRMGYYDKKPRKATLQFIIFMVSVAISIYAVFVLNLNVYIGILIIAPSFCYGLYSKFKDKAELAQILNEENV